MTTPPDSTAPRGGTATGPVPMMRRPLRGRTLAVVGLTAAVVLAGVGMGVQARMNGELATVSGDWSWAALVSFGGGLVILAIAALGSKRRMLAIPRIVGAVRAGRLRWFQTIGGFGGALFVAVQSTTAPALGIALFTVSAVAGQTIGGLVADRAGIGPAGPQRVSLPRVAGGVLVVIAVLLSVTGRIDGHFPAWMLLLPIFSGFFVAFQQAFNGRVRIETDTYTSTMGNFIAGTIALALVFAAHRMLAGEPLDWSAPWWAYLGGLVGLYGIAISAVAVNVIGVLRLALSLVTGQLVGSLALDLVLPTPATVITPWTFVGLALAFVAIVTASVRWGRR
ncbi:MAG: DMT family transporter [Pseudoclavibacter sp.]